MTNTEKDIQNIIKQITQEVLKQLNIEQEKRSGALAIFADYVFNPSAVAKHLREKYTEFTCALFENADLPVEGCNTRPIETAEDRKKLAAQLKQYDEIVIVTPSIWLVGALAKADDTDYTAMLALRPLLWGKKVTILLDFEVPKFLRASALSNFVEDISTLEKTGFTITSLQQDETAKEETKELVTEQDVKEAYKNKAMCVKASPGAIVTQLAEDTAKELGVVIEF